MKQEYIYQNDNLTIMPGFYESILFNSDTLYYINEDEKDYAESEGREFVGLDIDDFTEFRNDVCEKITDNLISPLLCEDSEICDKVEFGSVSSPRQYNFTTDEIDLKLNIDLDLLKQRVQNDKELYDCFDEYLKVHYTSYDGFMSFVENNAKDYFNEDRYLDVLIDFYLLTKIHGCKDVVACEENNEWTEYWYDITEIADQCLWEHLVPVTETLDTIVP